MGVCNKIAGAIAPLLLVGAIVNNPNEIDEVQQQLITASIAEQNSILDALSARLVFPYLVISFVLIGLGLIIKLTSLPDIDDENANNISKPSTFSGHATSNLLQHKHLILGAIALFCAVGVEVLVIDSIINYAQHTGLSFREAKYFATYTLIVMIVSYGIGIVTIPKLISQRKILMISAGIGITLTIFAVFVEGTTIRMVYSFYGFGKCITLAIHLASFFSRTW